MTDLDLTEFTWVDPDEMHLVGTPTNGVPIPLLAKAAEALTETAETLVKEFATGLCGDAGCDICNARLGALKGTDGAVEKAKMRAKERHGLSDSDFAFPDQRKEPLNDEAHVRNAMSRFSSVEGVSAEDRKAAAHRILRRAKELGIDVSDDSDVARAAKQTAPDRSVPEGDAEAQTRENVEGDDGSASTGNEDLGDALHVPFPHGAVGDGQGDTAPDKSLPVGEAESQTRSLSAAEKAGGEGGGSGTTAPDKDLHEGEAESQTEGNTEGNAKGAVPPADRKVTADLETARDALNAAIAAQAEDNEGWESGETQQSVRAGEHDTTKGAVRLSAETEGTVRRSMQALSDLLDHHTTSVTKEIEDMNTDELMKLLDERDAARRQADKKDKAKKTKKDKDREATKAAEKAAKAAGVTVESPELVELRKQQTEMAERIAKMEAEDGKRPFVNTAGVTAILRGGGEGADNVFKQLDDKVTSAGEAVKSAVTELDLQRAKADLTNALKQRAMAKMVAQENGRRTGNLPTARFGPNSVDLFSGSTLTLPDDVTVKGF